MVTGPGSTSSVLGASDWAGAEPSLPVSNWALSVAWRVYEPMVSPGGAWTLTVTVPATGLPELSLNWIAWDCRPGPGSRSGARLIGPSTLCVRVRLGATVLLT